MAMEANSEHEALLTPSEVAAMFRVNPKTVTRWARAGKISAIRTLGGHRRFRASEIRRFLEQVEEGSEVYVSPASLRRPGPSGPGRLPTSSFHMVAGDGVDPSTPRFSGVCSAN